MSRISKFLKVDRNILLEYVYDDGNNLSESYDILVNTKDRTQSYLASSTSATGNTQANSLFKLDNLANRWGKIDTSFYTFLSVRNYSTSTPIRHDTLRVHLPINSTFGEYLGFYVRIYGFDSINEKTYDLSNFYFDMSDASQTYLLNYTSPPLLFSEKLWGKNIKIEIPALSQVAGQLTNNRPKENSINSNLTGGAGLSTTSPIFIDFHFINNIQTINKISTYLLGPKIAVSLSQTPDFESLGLAIEHSKNGDFFEIYGTYNGTIAGFNKFIDDSYFQNHRYYVNYNITTYEQNIRGKTITATVTENFNETIEFRPIIKFSTTTAIIDVEMKLIDAVDDTYIIRRASYGMLQDEVSRYSLNLIKINLKNANKPKIYNIKNSIDPSLVGVSNAMGTIQVGGRVRLPNTSNQISSGATLLSNDPNNSFTQTTLPGGVIITPDTSLVSNAPSNLNNLNNSMAGGAGGAGGAMGGSGTNPSIETVKIPFPVLIERVNIMSRSDSAILNNEKYYANGLITIMINPFDNMFKFSIATGDPIAPKLFDLSGFSEIKFVIKADKAEVSFPLFTQSTDMNLKEGKVIFKITQSKFTEIKKIFTTGVNIFYIIGGSGGSNFVIYSGLFKIYDSPATIAELNQSASKAGLETGGAGKIDAKSGVNGISLMKVDSEIKLDPTISSSIRDISKKISTESLPKIKPSLNKDLNNQINQLRK